MSSSARAVLLTVVVLAATAGCTGGIFGKQYEYEEDLSLGIDGSATLVINASIAALVALRGLDLDQSPSAGVDRDKIRSAYESPVSRVTRVSPPWRRAGRRFVQIRLEIPDIRKLNEAAPLSWSRYEFGAQNGHHVFEQKVGASALRAGTLQNVGWNGSEIVAFRLHLPSRIIWHNSRDLVTNQPRQTGRGNILGWEQHLTDRLDGTPLDIRVEMDSQSILHRTLWLFAGAFLAAVALLALAIWLTVRQGAAEAARPVP
ncbi:MAG: hypothetical protein ABI818_18475 [Acidobacteriota bacterium]